MITANNYTIEDSQIFKFLIDFIKNNPVSLYEKYEKHKKIHIDFIERCKKQKQPVSAKRVGNYIFRVHINDAKATENKVKIFASGDTINIDSKTPMKIYAERDCISFKFVNCYHLTSIKDEMSFQKYLLKKINDYQKYMLGNKLQLIDLNEPLRSELLNGLSYVPGNIFSYFKKEYRTQAIKYLQKIIDDIKDNNKRSMSKIQSTFVLVREINRLLSVSILYTYTNKEIVSNLSESEFNEELDLLLDMRNDIVEYYIKIGVYSAYAFREINFDTYQIFKNFIDENYWKKNYRENDRLRRLSQLSSEVNMEQILKKDLFLLL